MNSTLVGFPGPRPIPSTRWAMGDPEIKDIVKVRAVGAAQSIPPSGRASLRTIGCAAQGGRVH